MKCPKCGYNSFEYLDSCKKCKTDLIAFKASHGIRPTILPAVALASGGNSEEQHTDFQSLAAPPPVQESDNFSWDDSPEEQSSETGAFAGLGLNLPPEEPDHFNFSLDLPESETEEARGAGNDPFEESGTEGNDFFLQPEAAAPVQLATEEPVPQEETPFGELSFDELYGGEETSAAPAEPAADEPLPDFFGAADAPPAEEPVSDDDFGSLLEIERNADGSAPIETAGAFDADPFQVEETVAEEAVTQEEPGDGEPDLMGLSPEEYESLFGEAPKKKKPVEVS